MKKNARFLELIKIPITLLFLTRVRSLELKLFTKYINNNTLQSAPHKNVDRPIFAVSGADKFFPDYVDIVGIIHPECDSHQSTFHLPQQAGYVCTMEI